MAASTRSATSSSKAATAVTGSGRASRAERESPAAVLDDPEVAPRDRERDERRKAERRRGLVGEALPHGAQRGVAGGQRERDPL